MQLLYFLSKEETEETYLNWIDDVLVPVFWHLNIVILVWVLSYFFLFFSERLLYVWQILQWGAAVFPRQDSVLAVSASGSYFCWDTTIFVGSKEDRDHASLLLYCGSSLAVAGTFGLWLVHAQFLSLSSCAGTVPDMGRLQPFPIPLHRAVLTDTSNARITVSQNISDLEGTHKDLLIIVVYYRHT